MTAVGVTAVGVTLPRLRREYELQMKIKNETLSGGRVKAEDRLVDITLDPL